MSRRHRLLLVLAMSACTRYDDDPALLDVSQFPIVFEGNTTAYMGRVRPTDSGGVLMSWAGTAAKTRFAGSQVTAHIALQDNGEPQSFMQVVLDGNDAGIVAIDGSTDAYPIEAVGEGPHTLEIYKLTESMYGDWQFDGFSPADGGALLATALPNGRKLVFIGDSLTCGYGNLGEITTEMLTSSLNSDENNLRDCNYFLGVQPYQVTSAYQAFGAQLAQQLQAQWQQICWSGRGVYRNSDGSTDGTLPKVWTRTVASDPNSASTSALADFVPQVVFINAGTNDFGALSDSSAPGGGPPDVKAFEAAYLGMLKQVRQAWPSAWIYLSTGPLLSDYYPTSFKALSTMRSALRSIIGKSHDKRMRYFEFPVFISYAADGTCIDPTGCEYHPDVAQDANMAKQVALRVQSDLGWQ